MPTPLLTVNAVTKRFGVNQPPVVKEVSFSVYPGEIFALLGPSGCGKTTTLRIIAGFEQADAGTIVMDKQILAGADIYVPPESRGIGFVFQDYALFPHKNVFENVAFGLRRATKRERRERASEILRMVDLIALQSRLPHHLSGGEQQRISIARALLKDAPILVLDEATSSLDTQSEALIQESLVNLMEGRTSFIIAHRLSTVVRADKILVIKDGEILETGTHETLLAKGGLYQKLCEMQFS